ncbi:MAG: hypothetical protein ACO3AY_07960 [Chitinophagaceae bacterium]
MIKKILGLLGISVFAFFIWPTPYSSPFGYITKDSANVVRYNRITQEMDCYWWSDGVWRIWKKPKEVANVILDQGNASKTARQRIIIQENPFTHPDRQKRYFRFYNCAVGEQKMLDTFNENNGKGLCRLFLGDDGNYSGQFWDLRRSGSLSNQFLGPAREVAINEKDEWIMGVEGTSVDKVSFVPDTERKAFKIVFRGKYLSADPESKYPGSSHLKVFSAERDLGDKSSWKAFVSDRALAE